MLREKVLKLINESGKRDFSLEKEMGFKQASIANWRRNIANPSTEAIIKIARYFNVTADYLLGISDTSTPTSAVAASAPAPVPPLTELQRRCAELSAEQQEIVLNFLNGLQLGATPTSLP